MTVTVHVDVSTLEGQEIIREMENHKSVVVIETFGDNKEELIPPTTYSLEETYENPYEKLRYHYGVNFGKRPQGLDKIILDYPEPETEESNQPTTHSVEYIRKLLWDKINKYYNTYIRE